MLSKENYKELAEFIENTTIDETQLESYRWDSNPYGVESHLIGSSPCYVWDEDEEWEARKRKAIEILRDDGLEDYFDFPNSSLEEVVKEIKEM